jgi:hypothetical protein
MNWCKRNMLIGGSIAAVSLAMALAADGAAGKAATTQVTRRPGYIVGTAKSECGKPLSTFTVNAYGFDGQPNEFPFGSPPLGRATGHNGKYALRTRDNTSHQPVNALVDSIEGSSTVHYEGHKYVLPLYPTDGIANFKGHSGKGIIRNFVLKVSGTKVGESKNRDRKVVEVGDPAANSFYGTSMTMFLALGDVTGQTLTVNFKPVTSQLADGCKARAFSRSITLPQFGGELNWIFQDIPLAFYTLTATLRGTTTQTVRLALSGQNTTRTSVPFDPVPTSLFADGSGGPNVFASLTSSPYGS